MPRRALKLALGGGVAAAGAAGYLVRRRMLATHPLAEDPEWQELHQPLHGREHRVSAPDGTRLRVLAAGPEGAPTIVLSHGYGMALRFWHHQIRSLSDEFRVVAYDQRGHAGSEPAASGEYSTEALADDLEAVLDAVLDDGQQAFVAGHSMGGMTIMSYAQRHPAGVGERFAGAALLSTGASRLILSSGLSTGIAGLGRVEEAFGRRILGMHRGMAAQTNELSFLVTRAVALGPKATRAQAAFTEQLFVDTPAEVRSAFGQMLSALDVREGLANLTVPTLVLVGEHDRLTPPHQARILASELKQADLVELPGHGHMIPLEAPGTVTGLLRRHARAAFRAAG